MLYAVFTGGGVMVLVLWGFILMVICRLLNAIRKMLLNTANENGHVKIEVDGKQLSVTIWTDDNSAYIGDKGSKWVTYNTDYNDI